MHKSAFTYRLEFVDLDKIYASINWNYIKIIYILSIISLENPTEEKETMTKIEKFAENLLNYLKDTNYTATYDGVEILGVGVINSNVLSNEIAIRTKNGLVSFNDSETNCINKIKITKSLQVDVNSLLV